MFSVIFMYDHTAQRRHGPASIYSTKPQLCFINAKVIRKMTEILLQQMFAWVYIKNE